MNRAIQQDYEKLVSYFTKYNLNDIITDTNFLNNIKSIHKKLYSYMTFMCEAENNNLFSSHNITNYYGETGSDLILSLFCWANGAYKSAEFQLRSAIENFLKAALYSEWADTIQCKNVFEIMDFASNSHFFANNICQAHLVKIKNIYSLLCAFVHSSPEKLFSQKALIQLPKYDSKNANEFTKNFQGVMNSLLSILYYNYYHFVFSIHNANRDIFFQGLTPTDKANIYLEKTKEI